jgi:hypothetical protein
VTAYTAIFDAYFQPYHHSPSIGCWLIYVIIHADDNREGIWIGHNPYQTLRWTTPMEVSMIVFVLVWEDMDNDDDGVVAVVCVFVWVTLARACHSIADSILSGLSLMYG